nr:immunoglobulin heavy chain junction region [Macaca mulatta]MOV48915.1 immunoglobulin heavy chain junction region [Macaca mulatta]MOV49097.1 immunoglobulin heavy chain junction region [Macaca mulatta]MOV49195.1 immunoglobulin heavy chain junction region [Macaca mulatta]MOV49399.1 immunoglobulin heavy chain junction region [Macaca mulatta]
CAARFWADLSYW